MKKAFVYLFLLLCLISCNRQSTIVSMKGVKTMKETHIEPSDRFGQMQLTDTISVIITKFNENGATESMSEYDEDGLSCKYTFTHTDSCLTIGRVWGLDLIWPVTEYEDIIYDDNHIYNISRRVDNKVRYDDDFVYFVLRLLSTITFDE